MSTEQSYLGRLKFDPKLAFGVVSGYLRNFRLTLLLLVVILGGGLASYFNLPQRLNPEINIPIVSVSAVLPGASPQDVESLLTIPLEDAINGVANIDTISSASRENVSVIQIQFNSGVDPKLAEQDVKAAVDKVTGLPTDATTPQVKAFDFEDTPVWTFAISAKDDDLPSLMRFAKRLQDEIDGVAKVDRIELSGYEEQEVQVVVSPEKMRQLGLNAMSLAQLVQRSASAYPAGNLNTGDYTMSLTINPQITTIEDVRNIRLTVQGTQMRLGEIAQISERSRDGQNESFMANAEKEGRRVVTFYVYKTRAADINATGDAVREVVNETMKSVEGRFEIENVLNTSDEIRHQFEELLGEFATTIGLVFICLWLFVGLRQAIISSFTVPLTFLAAFLVMPFFGMSINFLTLFAFLLALGLLIDDTIVVVSGMTTYYRSGKFTPFETGRLVWKDFIVPIWSTTITTIWSFVPLLLASGIIGEFIKPIPVVISIVMICSTAIAVLITLPLMMIILKPQIPSRIFGLLRVLFFVGAVALIIAIAPKNSFLPFVVLAYFLLLFLLVYLRKQLLARSKEVTVRQSWLSGGWQKVKPYLDKPIIHLEPVAEGYKKIILRVLDSRSARIQVIVGIVLFSLVSYALVPLGLVKNEFFPATDEDLVYVDIEYPAGSSVASVTQHAKEVLNTLRMVEDVNVTLLDVGRSAAGSMSGGGGSGQNVAGFTLHLNEERELTSMEVAENVRALLRDYDKGTVSVVEVSGGPPAGADIQIELSGDDLQTVDGYAQRVVDFLKSRGGLTNVSKSLKPGPSQIVFVPNKAAMLEKGVTVEQVGGAMRVFASGLELDSIKFANNGDEDEKIVLKVGEGTRSVEDLGRLTIAAGQEQLPLSALGRLETQQSPTQISRQNLKRTVTVTAAVQEGKANTTEEGQKLEEFAKTLDLPSGYAWSTGGVNEENARSVQSIVQAMGLAFVLILVTMVIQFGSFRQAFIALVVIPLAVSSVFFVFAITGTPLSFPALIGVLALFGIIVTNSMFIIDKINLNRREGMPFKEAVADAGSSRLEPIVLTKLCTVLGLLPVTLSTPLWRGLGGAIISGVLLASTFMLLFIPVVYYAFFAKEEEAKDRNRVLL